MENTKATLDKVLKRSIFLGWESSNAKNATELEIQNAKMHWGFTTAFDNYFGGRRDPQEFAQTIQSAGFSDDWPLHEREAAIARLAIKKKLRMWGDPQEKLHSMAQFLLSTLIAVYNSVRDQQET